MARCQRCDACESMWDTSPCRHCGFPGPDVRSPEMIEEDDKLMNERLHPEED